MPQSEARMQAITWLETSERDSERYSEQDDGRKVREAPSSASKVKVQSRPPVVRVANSAAAQRARGNVAFYASIPSYRSYFADHGFGDMFDALVDARRSQPLERVIDLVPLEAARTFAVCGTADQVGQEIERIAEHADSLCVKPPLWGLDPADADEQSRRLEHLLVD